MGGDIIVHSEEGVGSTFDIYIINKRPDDMQRHEVIKLDLDYHNMRERERLYKLEIKESNLEKVINSSIIRTS